MAKRGRKAARRTEQIGSSGREVTTRVPEVQQERASVPVVTKAHQKCPHCGSVRSKLIKTEPMDERGRMEYRKCVVCLGRFCVVDRLYSKK